MEISVRNILVPTGSARTILENFPASVTKAGRAFFAVMVTLHLIHYNILWDRDLYVIGMETSVIAQHTLSLLV